MLLLFNCNSNTKTPEKMDVNSKEYKVFTEQEHRFELDACEFKYNGKPFKIGMTLKEFENIFGKKYIKSYDDLIEYWGDDMFYVWFNDNSEVIAFRIFTKCGYVLVKDAFLDKNILMQDFIKKSNKYKFEDFLIISDGYNTEEDVCGYYYRFNSPVVFNRIGSGHIALTGEPKLDETNPVNSISVGLIRK